MKSKKILIITSLFFIIYCSAFIASNVYAGYKTEVTIPYGPKANEEATLSSYVKGIYAFALGIVVITALAVLVVAGFMYMLSGTVTTQEKAKEYLWGAIGGLILALAAYLILYTINPDLLKTTPPVLPNVNTPANNTPPANNPPRLLARRNSAMQAVRRLQIAENLLMFGAKKTVNVFILGL